jgi:hypothetical protein
MSRFRRPLPLVLLPLAFAGCDQFEDPDLAQIQFLEPDSGAVGALVQIGAENLFNNTRVLFEDRVPSRVAALFLDRVVAVVPEGAVSGDIRLETGGELSSSRAFFKVIAEPPTTPAFFEDQTGQAVTSFIGGCATGAPGSDDGAAQFALPFAFPFYGRPQEQVFVATNGIVTFGEPRPCDNNGNTSDFTTDDKIAVLGFDLQPGIGGEVLVNVADPGQVVVTWSEVALCGLPETSNTFQLVLFPDGRIRMNFGYLSTDGVGIACPLGAAATGSISGITPSTPSGSHEVTYAALAGPSLAEPQEFIVDRFFIGRLFAVENRSVLFTPLEESGVFAGYQVELLPAE